MADAGRERMQDLDDRLDRLAHRIRSLSDLLTSALDARLTQLGIRQNEDMRRISAWAAIFAVPTLVAGVYGMNFEHMPELHAGYGHHITVVAVITFALLM